MKRLTIIAGFLLSLVFLWLALKDTHWNAISASFQVANAWYLLPMLACLGTFYLLRAVRWRRILGSSHPTTTLALLPPILIGAAGNNLLPAHLGEIVRIYYTSTKLQIPKATVLATLIVERVFDLMAVLVIFAAALLSVSVSDKLKMLALLLMFGTAFLYLICWLISKYSDRFITTLRRLTTGLSPAVSSAVLHHASNLAAGMTTSLQSGRERRYVALNSLVQWLFMAGCIYCAILAFNLQVGVNAAAVVLGITVIGLLLPTSPGFFGTIEYAFVLGLGALGIDASTAFSIAVFYHIPVWIVICVTGVSLFLANNLSISDLIGAEKSTPD